MYLYEKTGNSLVMVRDDDKEYKVTLYAEAEGYEHNIPLLKCAESYFSFIFGVFDSSYYKGVTLNEENTAIVIFDVLQNTEDTFKDKCVMHSKLVIDHVDTGGVTLTFYVYYHLWMKGEDDTSWKDYKTPELTFSFELTQAQYLKALTYVTVQDEEYADELITYITE